ncbi:TPA: hypothetical protein OT801_000583 [Morganella morganii]|nr:hypothetical protein [Morganella morganii]HCT7721696.1 hypothetical protein [Morganella morganii]
MSITKEQWAGIEESLKAHYVVIKFQYQDTEIAVTRVSVSEGRTKLAVYFNGKIGGAWGLPDSENFNPLCKLFWHKRTKSLYTPGQIKDLEKAYGKRAVKREIPDLYTKYTYYRPHFAKASVLVRQFRRIKGLTVEPQKEWVTLRG